MRKPDWTVIWDGGAFVPLPLAEAARRLRPRHKHHAESLAEKLNCDAVTIDVAERFGPGEVTA